MNQLEKTRSLTGKKTIVTGGAGFIGSHICEELLNAGAEVISIDDYSAGNKRNIEFMKANPKFKAYKKDVCDKDGWDEIFAGCDTIFHNAASKKNVCLINPFRDLSVNAGGTLNLLQLAVKHGVRKFVHASTGSVYGEPIVFPTKEDHPLRPVSYYGVSKLAGERYVEVFHRLYGLDTTILRYFHVYGPRQESNEFGGVVSIFLRNIIEGKPIKIFGHGNQVRSFTWVKDLVKINLEAAVNPKARGAVYNAASGIKISINELANRMCDMMNSKVEIIYDEPLIGDIMFFDVSNEAVCRDLNVSFEKDFWGTLNRTLVDFKEYFKKVLK